MFGYVKCDINIPELKRKFQAFQPVFKNTVVCRSDIGEFLKKYAGENEILIFNLGEC